MTRQEHCIILYVEGLNEGGLIRSAGGWGVLAYWSVRELGISGTKVGKRLGLSQSAISPAKAGFKEVNNWFSASFTMCQSIDYLYTIHETHKFMGVPLSRLGVPLSRLLMMIYPAFSGIKKVFLNDLNC